MNHEPLIFGVLPEGYIDSVFTDVDCHFSLKDRLKILFGWQLTIKTQTNTKVWLGGGYESTAEIIIWRPRKSKHLFVTDNTP